MKKILFLAVISLLFIDFNGLSSNYEDWVFGWEAVKMHLQGIF